MNSTGPITEAGKAVSRMNALKTGIYAKGEAVLPTEKIEDLQRLTDEYYGHYAPADPVQRNLVDTLINSEWLLRRFRRIEADMLNRITLRSPEIDNPARMGIAFSNLDKVLGRLQTRINATQRNFAQALKLLRELRAEAAKPKQTQAVNRTDQFVPSAPKPAHETPSPKPPATATTPENPAPPLENRPPNAA